MDETEKRNLSIIIHNTHEFGKPLAVPSTWSVGKRKKGPRLKVRDDQDLDPARS